MEQTSNSLPLQSSNHAIAAHDPVSSLVSQLSHTLASSVPVCLAVEPTMEGILAATGVVYLAGAVNAPLRLARADHLQPRLGEAVLAMPPTTDNDVFALADRVHSAFARTCGKACAFRLALAAASDDSAMPQVLYDYLRLGFSVKDQLYGLIADERCIALSSLAHYSANECEHVRQFLRFSHLADGSWMAQFEPQADVIPLEAQHFVRRMRSERFFIVDPVHQVAAFHLPDEPKAQIVRLDDQMTELLLDKGKDLAKDEEGVRELWKHLYAALTLPGRDASQRGYDLRVSWMPKRFWKNLTELQS